MFQINQDTAKEETVSVKEQTTQKKQKLSIGLIIGLVLGSALISIFYATSTYKSQTDHDVELASTRASLFEEVFTQLKQARFRSMGLAADIMVRDREFIDPFIKSDRQALSSKIDPFFAFLKAKHGIVKVNFWIPPATLFYSADGRELGQIDESEFRYSIVAANKRQERIMAVETGLGGLIGIRGIVPVIWDDKFYGALELVSDFHIPLHYASEESQFKWGSSITKERFAQVERKPNEKEDVHKGNDIYIDYSDAETRDIIKAIDFDPRSKEGKTVEWEGRTLYVRTFPVYSFNGLPGITIATIGELTNQFNAALKLAVIKGSILFLLLASALVIGYSKLDHLRTKFLGAVGAEKRLLKERLVIGDAAIEKLKDLEILKRRYFFNLIAAINHPLLAVSGHLAGIKEALTADSTVHKGEIDSKINFSIKEIEHIRHLTTDYEQIELFRQNLITTDAKLVAVHTMFEAVLKRLDFSARLPNLQVMIDLPDESLSIYGDSRMLVEAISRLIMYTAHSSLSGKLNISVQLIGSDVIGLNFSGSVYAGSLAPSAALLDEARQFISELSTVFISDVKREKLIGIILAKVTIEHFGGTLTVGPIEQPGFIVRFPAAV